MFCNNCGKEIDENSVFCRFCGAKNTNNLINNEIKETKNVSIIQKLNEIKCNLSKKISRKVVATSIGVIFIIAIVLVIFLVKSNSENRFFSLINSGRTSEAIMLYNEKINNNEKLKSNVLEISKDNIKQITKDYESGKLTYKETIEKLNNYKDVNYIYSDLTTAIKKVHNLNESVKAYNSALIFEKNEDIQNAIKNYAVVIEADINYNKAQDKITELSVKYKNLVVSNASSMANGGTSNDYNSALKEINTALEIVSKDADLLALKDDYSKKYEVAKSAEEAAELEKIKLNPGKVIESNGWQITYNSTKLSAKVNPDSTNGSYIYYTSDDGEIFLDLIFTAKNISTDMLHLNSILSNLTVTYNNKYKYTSYRCFYSIGDQIDPVYDWDGLDALKSVTYHVVVALPREASSNSYPIEATLNIAGQKQYLKYR